MLLKVCWRKYSADLSQPNIALCCCLSIQTQNPATKMHFSVFNTTSCWSQEARPHYNAELRTFGGDIIVTQSSLSCAAHWFKSEGSFVLLSGPFPPKKHTLLPL